MRILFLFAPLLIAFAGAALAQPAPIQIADAEARATPPGATTGVIYMTVMNHQAEDDTLTGLSTPVAEKAEMHRTVVENGVTRMDAVPSLTIKAKGGITFAPAGLHVMLVGLRRPLKPDDSFPLTLNFEKSGPVAVVVSVAPLKPAAHSAEDMPGMKM